MVRSIAEAMFAEDGELEPARLGHLLDSADASVSAASKTLRLGLRVALFFVRWSPILLLCFVRPLERLRTAERVAVLARLERSSFVLLSLAFVGWRTVLTLLFYEHPTELAAIGYRAERTRYQRRLPVVPSIDVAVRASDTAPDAIGLDAAVRRPEMPPPPAPVASGVQLHDDEEVSGSSREVA